MQKTLSFEAEPSSSSDGSYGKSTCLRASSSQDIGYDNGENMWGPTPKSSDSASAACEAVHDGDNLWGPTPKSYDAAAAASEALHGAGRNALRSGLSLDRTSSGSHVSFEVDPVSSSTASRSGGRGSVTSQVEKHMEIDIKMFKSVTAASTFKANESELIRGIPMNDLLHRGAAVLETKNHKTKQAAEFDHSDVKDLQKLLAAYRLSKQVDSLDIFLSHNWSISRFKKFMALALYFNLRGATVVAALTSFLILYLQIFELLPMFHLPYYKAKFGEEDLLVGIWTLLITPSVFVFCILFQHDIIRLVHPGSATFLDKACIDQIDLRKQQAGIAKLGAFLVRSSRMVVLYSDVYLSKLWTVYEIAVFLVTRTNYHMEVLHVSLVPLVFGAGALLLFINITFLLPLPPLVADMNYLFWYGPGISLGFAFLCRRGQRDLARTWGSIKEFRLEYTTCFDEADRPLIYAQIVAFLKCAHYVDMEATVEETLGVFDELVREIVWRCVEESLGNSPIPLKHLLIAMCLTEFASCLDVLPGLIRIYSGSDVRVWSHVLNNILTVAMMGMCAEALAVLMSKCLHLSGWRDHAWVVCSSLAVFVSVVAPFKVTSLWLIGNVDSSREFAMDFWILTVLVAASVMALALVHARARCQRKTFAHRATERRISFSHHSLSASQSRGVGEFNFQGVRKAGSLRSSSSTCSTVVREDDGTDDNKPTSECSAAQSTTLTTTLSSNRSTLPRTVGEECVSKVTPVVEHLVVSEAPLVLPWKAKMTSPEVASENPLVLPWGPETLQPSVFQV